MRLAVSYWSTFNANTSHLSQGANMKDMQSSPGGEDWFLSYIKGYWSSFSSETSSIITRWLLSPFKPLAGYDLHQTWTFDPSKSTLSKPFTLKLLIKYWYYWALKGLDTMAIWSAKWISNQYSIKLLFVYYCFLTVFDIFVVLLF